jgi:phage FluMu gp28-like protein
LPGTGYVDFIPFWYQQEILTDYSQNRAVVKARQTGLSTVFGAEAGWELTHIAGAMIILLSKNKDASENLLKYVKDILLSVADSDPDGFKITKITKNTIEVEGGGRIVSIPASQETGRSYSASHWYFDEIAHTPYVDDIFQAAAPTVAQTGGRITVFSSPKGKGNLLYDIKKRPEDFGFTVHDYPWWCNPVYNPYLSEMLALEETSDEFYRLLEKAKQGAWYKKTHKQHSDLAFKQEFECNFDSDADSVFNQRQLDKAFYKKNYLESKFSPDLPDMEWYAEAPVEGHYYATGVDFGRKRDPSVLVTYDITCQPARLVEYKRVPAGNSWEQILLTVRETYETFNCDMLCDATGIGDVIFESISDIAEPYIISDNQYSRNKYNLIENVRRAMDNRAIKLPRIPQLYKEHENYLWQDKAIVQDSVIANALAVYNFYEPETAFVGADSGFNFLEGELGDVQV